MIQQQLRQSTADLHRVLDAQPQLKALLSPELTPQSYQQALLALLTPHVFLESCVMRTLPESADNYVYQARAAALQQDLEQLGYDTEYESVEDHQRTLLVPELIAYLYLLEGSKLGSQQIAKIIQRRGLDLPMRFFQQAESQSWPLFWQFAAQKIQTPQQLDEACAYARQAFRFYIAYVGEGRFQPQHLNLAVEAI